MPASTNSPELDRLAALDAYQTLDEEGAGAFDRYTRLAATIMGTPMAAISLVGSDRVWLKYAFGLPPRVFDRRETLCADTILQDEPAVVSDALLDARFAQLAVVRGAPHVRFYAGAPLRTPGQLRVGTLCVFDTQPRPVNADRLARLEDLAGAVVTTFELFKSMREIKLLALSDALTGLPNRLHLYHALAGAIARAVRYRTPFSLLYIDCDNFKHVNDTMGHICGDVLLQSLATAMRACLRTEELPGRMGGDEFMVILPAAGPQAAQRAGERVRTVCNAAMEAEGWPTTLSVGAITFLLPPASADDAIALADEVMYEAKRGGKNQVRSAIVGKRQRLTVLEPTRGRATF